MTISPQGVALIVENFRNIGSGFFHDLRLILDLSSPDEKTELAALDELRTISSRIRDMGLDIDDGEERFEAFLASLATVLGADGESGQ